MSSPVQERHATSIGHAAGVPDTAGVPWRGVVRSVSASSCVAFDTGGRALVVHATAHGHTPTSVLVDDAAPAAWGVRAGDRVTWRAGRLHLGDALVVHTTTAGRWAPPSRPSVASGAVDASGALLAVALDPDAVARTGAGCDALVAALGARDRAATAVAAHALVGNGPGSTPSGDDALVALSTVLDRAGHEGAHAMLAAAVAPLLDRTTPLAAHYLRLACAGHAGEPLLALVDAALGGALRPHDPRTDRVRRAGATSGADALVGVVAGLRAVGAASRGALVARRCAA